MDVGVTGQGKRLVGHLPDSGKSVEVGDRPGRYLLLGLS